MTKKKKEYTFEDVSNEVSFEVPDEVIFEDQIATLEAAVTSKPEPEPELEVEGPSEKEASEYLIIYDAIMFEDKFEKTYPIGTKYKVVFTTRSADADMKISRQLDGMNFSTMHAFQTMSAVLTMSHSLVALNGTDCSKMSIEDRYNFLRGKSSHLIELLADRMIKFDYLVRNALEYGEANF